MSFEGSFSPEEIPYTTANYLKTSYNSKHRLCTMLEGELEIQNRLDPCKSQQDIQNLLHALNISCCETCFYGVNISFFETHHCYEVYFLLRNEEFIPKPGVFGCPVKKTPIMDKVPVSTEYCSYN